MTPRAMRRRALRFEVISLLKMAGWTVIALAVVGAVIVAGSPVLELIAFN
jgi:hypothetical protein